MKHELWFVPWLCLVFLVGAVVLGGWDGFAGAMLGFASISAEVCWGGKVR